MTLRCEHCGKPTRRRTRCKKCQRLLCHHCYYHEDCPVLRSNSPFRQHSHTALTPMELPL